MHGPPQWVGESAAPFLSQFLWRRGGKPSRSLAADKHSRIPKGCRWLAFFVRSQGLTVRRGRIARPSASSNRRENPPVSPLPFPMALRDLALPARTVI